MKGKHTFSGHGPEAPSLDVAALTEEIPQGFFQKFILCHSFIQLIFELHAVKNRDGESPRIEKTYPSSPVASTGPPTDFHGIRWDPGETAGHTIQMVRCECSWLVSSGILWGGGSSGEPTPAPPAGFWERHKGYMCCLPPEITSLGTPMPSGHAQLPWGGGDQWPMAQPTWNMKGAPWPSAQGTWEDGSRRVLAGGSGDLETEFFHYGTSCLLIAYRRIRNRCPLFQEDAAEHQLDFSPDLTAP